MAQHRNQGLTASRNQEPDRAAPAGTGKKARVAVVAYDSLGDGLIYLMMAENLSQNHFAVTYFGTLLSSLNAWLPNFEALPYPPAGQWDAVLKPFDLVLMSPPSFIRNRLPRGALAKMAAKYVLICQKTPDDWRVDHSERLQQALPRETYAALAGLPTCSGPIRFRPFKRASAVEMALAFMREKMRLEAVDKAVTLDIPRTLIRRRHLRRVIISPDSAGPAKKEWSPKRFLRLAARLQREGYDPHIVVAPANHGKWAKMVAGSFPLPMFASIETLAAFIYESGVLIANDSGNGHLASFLAIPTITIYRKRNPFFHWRPDWGPGVVVYPRLTLPRPGGDRVWSPFVSLRRIVREVERLT